MRRSVVLLMCVGVALMVPAALTFAEDGQIEDHPLISRFPGAEFYQAQVTEFDEYLLPLAPLERNRLTDTRTLEGKVTQIQYSVEGRSTLEVYRSYQSALRGAGFEVLFENDADSWNPTAYWVQRVYDPHGIYWKSSRRSTFVGNGFRYLAARLEHPDGDVYVTLYTTPARDNTIIQLDVIETQPMQAGQITVDVDYLRSEIERSGVVTIHGLQFVANSAQMTPQSVPLIKEIAAYLKAHPSQNFYVVGHTTTIGAHENLMQLSAQRAEACVQALVRDHGISAQRLFAAGVGGLSPVATNATDEGRARNRRVELVLR